MRARGCGTPTAHEYLDLQTGLAVNSVGHCHPRVVEAIREQAGRLIHAGNLFYTEPALRLAERLATLAAAAPCTSPTPAPRPTRRR